MSVMNFEDLKNHIGHKIVVVGYRKDSNTENPIENVAIECEDCFEVLLDFDNDEHHRTATINNNYNDYDDIDFIEWYEKHKEESYKVTEINDDLVWLENCPYAVDIKILDIKEE